MFQTTLANDSTNLFLLTISKYFKQIFLKEKKELRSKKCAWNNKSTYKKSEKKKPGPMRIKKKWHWKSRYINSKHIQGELQGDCT
jgi:hypothetical protein